MNDHMDRMRPSSRRPGTLVSRVAALDSAKEVSVPEPLDAASVPVPAGGWKGNRIAMRGKRKTPR